MQNNRGFAIKLSKELHNKAGLAVKNNNFDPIMPAALLRVLFITCMLVKIIINTPFI